MSQFKQKSKPWILVVISMLMLFLFVGYWNFATYTKEKKQLSDDVEIQLQLAYTEVKDSELIFFIRTQLTDSITGKKFPDSISIFLDEHPMFPAFTKFKSNKLPPFENAQNGNPDTTIILDFKIENNIDTPFKGYPKGSEVTVITSSKHKSEFSDSSEKDKSDSSKFEFKIKQVNITGVSDPTESFILQNDTIETSKWLIESDSSTAEIKKLLDDTSGFKLSTFQLKDRLPGNSHVSIDKTYALLKEKLITNNLPSDFIIVQNPKSAIAGLRINYKTNSLGFSEWIIDLKNYHLFIFKKMVPTLFFSLLLLGMIGLAFWTLMTNWIKQNRLVVVKNEFISNMTHELKTPIATVGVALESIADFDLNTEQEKAKEYIEISRNEINRLSLLVDKVLNIAAFDAKKTALKKELVDLDKTIKYTIDSLKLQLDNHHITLNYHNEATNAKIVGDKLHLANVIHNIIDNAIKYSSDNPYIKIQLSDNKDNIILKIEDNGLGIPKAYLNKIFDRFFRVPNEDKHDVKGHGLGLNYVQNVIHNFGGQIVVASIENQGTTFTITLPKSISNV